MVHQHFSVIDALTVWENVTLGERGRIDARAGDRARRGARPRYGLDVDPRARVGDLTTGQRQRVEIIKCLRRNPDILILDEPTSVLTLAESDELFAVLRSVVRDEGRAVVLISHKLDEILHATDRVTIMRDGRVIARHVTSTTTAHELAREMVGREVSLRTEAAALGLIEVAAETTSDAVVDPNGQLWAPSVKTCRLVSTVGRNRHRCCGSRTPCATAPDGRRVLDGLDPRRPGRRDPRSRRGRRQRPGGPRRPAVEPARARLGSGRGRRPCRSDRAARGDDAGGRRRDPRGPSRVRLRPRHVGRREPRVLRPRRRVDGPVPQPAVHPEPGARADPPVRHQVPRRPDTPMGQLSGGNQQRRRAGPGAVPLAEGARRRPADARPRRRGDRVHHRTAAGRPRRRRRACSSSPPSWRRSSP